MKHSAIDVTDTKFETLSLDTFIQNRYLEGTDILMMKCNCINSKSKCEASQTTSHESPDYLSVQLGRFKNHNISKTESSVVPENEITFPNGDRFKLLGIADHLEI